MIGQRVAQLRAEAGLSQEALAARARDLGLDWSRSAVGALEVGNRNLDLEEFLVLLAAGGWSVADVIPDGLAITLSRASCRSHHVTEFLADEVAAEHFAEMLTTPERAEDELRQRVERDAKGSVERRVARIFGMTPEDVAQLALAKWGTPFTVERERRLQDRSDETTSPRSLQALRGRITREMLAELQPLIEDPELAAALKGDLARSTGRPATTTEE